MDRITHYNAHHTRLIPDLLLFFISLCLGILLFYCFGLSRQIIKTNMINSGYKSSNALSFFLHEDVPLSSNQIKSVLSTGNLLFKEEIGNAQTLILYSFRGNTNFDVVSGRQFMDDDLESPIELRQTGADLQYGKEMESVKTIGILGMPYPSRLDSTQIILPSRLERNVLKKGYWTIDGPRHPKQDYQKLTQLMGDVNVEVVPTEYTGTHRMYNQSNAMSVITGLVIILCVFGYVIIIRYWLDSYNQKIGILILFGINNLKIVSSLIGRCFSLLIGGSCVGVGLGLMYNRSINEYLSIYYGLGYVGMLVTMQLIATVVLIWRSKHWDLRKVL